MNKSDFIRQNAGNFLYVFIADDEVQYFNEAIRQKRLDQARYLQRVIVSWGYTQDDLIADLNAGLREQYGYDGRGLVRRLAAGHDVFQAGGVGDASAGAPAACSSDGYTLDPRTGFPAELVAEAVAGIGAADGGGLSVPSTEEWYQAQLASRPLTLGDYSSVFSNETGQPVGVWNTATGTQFSAYDAATGTWTQDTAATGRQKGNFWARLCEVMPWLISVVEWFVSLFGGKRANEVSATQSDGWFVPPSARSGQQAAGLGLVALLGLGALWMANRK